MVRRHRNQSPAAYQRRMDASRMRLEESCLHPADQVLVPGTLVSIVESRHASGVTSLNLSFRRSEGPLTGIGASPVKRCSGCRALYYCVADGFWSVFRGRFVRTLKMRAEKSQSKWDDTFFAALQGPARTLVWVVGLSFALERASIGLISRRFLARYVLP